MSAANEVRTTFTRTRSEATTDTPATELLREKRKQEQSERDARFSTEK